MMADLYTRKPVCKHTHTHTWDRVCLDKCAERDAILQLAEAKPTHARHITQWAFYSIIQAIPNPSTQASLEICSTERLLNGCFFGLLNSQSKPSAPGRTVSVTKERRPSEKEFLLLFFNTEITRCIIS